MAATGTPTPNIGLRIPLGTDPASVDDINYNSNLIDTKLGAVGNDSVQDQIDDLNSKLNNIEKIATATWNGLTFTVTRRGGVKQLKFEGFCTNATSGETVSLTWTYETGYSFADIHSATTNENFYKGICRSDFSNELISFYFGGSINFYPKTAVANTLFRGSFAYL